MDSTSLTSASAVPFLLDAAALQALPASSADLLEQAMLQVARRVSGLVGDAAAPDLFSEVFGRAGTDPGAFQEALAELWPVLAGPGLRLALELRSEGELQGAVAAYAAVGHTGGERV
jgi:hypothetical protein